MICDKRENCHFLGHLVYRAVRVTECRGRMGRWLVNVNNDGSVPSYHADDETKSWLQATAANTAEVRPPV